MVLWGARCSWRGVSHHLAQTEMIERLYKRTVNRDCVPPRKGKGDNSPKRDVSRIGKHVNMCAYSSSPMRQELSMKAGSCGGCESRWSYGVVPAS